MIFFFNGNPLIVLSQLGLKSFFCSLLYHLCLALFGPKVLGRNRLNKGLVFVEEGAVSKDDVLGQELPDSRNILLELHVWVFL